MKRKVKYRVIVSAKVRPYPEPHELSAARILAEYFQSDVSFLCRGLQKTADLCVNKYNTIWELKSPMGNGKHTIQNNLRKASKQSKNLVIDLRRYKM